MDLELISNELTDFYKEALESLQNEILEYSDTDPEMASLSPLRQWGASYEITDSTTEQDCIDSFKLDITNCIKYVVGDKTGTVSYSPTISVFVDDKTSTIAMVMRVEC